MFFMVINLAICAALIFFSFSFNNHRNGKRQNLLVNQTLFLSLLFGFMVLAIFFSFWGPKQLSYILFKLCMVFMAWFSLGCCSVILSIADGKKHTVARVIFWMLNIVAAYMVLFFPKCIMQVVIENDEFLITSASAFSGALAEKLPVSWFTVYCIFFVVFIPLLVVLMVLARAELTKSLVTRQNLRIGALAAFSCWAVFLLIGLGVRFRTMLGLLMLTCFLPELFLLNVAFNNTEVWGRKLAFRSILRFTLIYLVPALLEGAVFVLLMTLFPQKPVTITLLLIPITAFIVLTWVILGRHFNKLDALRNTDYDQSFEDDITSINYDDEPKKIMESFEKILKKYVDVSSVRLAVDAGTGFLETVFTDDKDKISIPATNPAFDALQNHKHPVVFRDFANNDYSVASVKSEIISLLDDTGSEAFIMLNEGRKIIGIIFLGKKTSGNRFTEYDYSVFTKQYSNFFVIGYFMKNILNESVVGTVNREIRMSAQIITSIQENMDYINNPKIDCGYRMIPAHNIGGEFVDLIRLNATRHLFVIGALSGKGIAASMGMVILKSIIRTNLAETKDFKVLVQKINEFIRSHLPKGSFFAGTFGLLDFETDTMYYINCGSPALFMYTKIYNNVIEIQGEGHVLGFAEDVSKLIRVKKVKLAAGDILLACTDGLVEARSLRGESYGKTRVQSQMLDNAQYPADKMSQFIYDALVQFSSKALEDDITILVMKYKGAEAK